jgi:hypothetical protein
MTKLPTDKKSCEIFHRLPASQDTKPRKVLHKEKVIEENNPTLEVKGGSHSGAQEGNDKSIVSVHKSNTQRVQTSAKEEDLKKEKRALFWAKWLHDSYENISEQQGWNTQKECKVDFDKLPPRNKAVMIRMGARLEIQFRIMEDKGFQLGKSQAQKSILEMIKELFSHYNLTTFESFLKEELTQKIKGDKTE